MCEPLLNPQAFLLPLELGVTPLFLLGLSKEKAEASTLTLAPSFFLTSVMWSYNDLFILLFLQQPLSPSLTHLFSPLVLSIVQGLQWCLMNADQRDCQVLHKYDIIHKHLLGTKDVSLNSRHSPYCGINVNPLNGAFAKRPMGCADTSHDRSLEQSREPPRRAVAARKVFLAQAWVLETHQPWTRGEWKMLAQKGESHQQGGPGSLCGLVYSRPSMPTCSVTEWRRQCSSTHSENKMATCAFPKRLFILSIQKYRVAQ